MRGRSTQPYDAKARNPQYTRDTKCAACGAETNLSTDHIVPRTRGGTDDVSNLQTLCRPCNASKLNYTMDEWMALGGPERRKQSRSKRLAALVTAYEAGEFAAQQWAELCTRIPGLEAAYRRKGTHTDN